MQLLFFLQSGVLVLFKIVFTFLPFQDPAALNFFAENMFGHDLVWVQDSVLFFIPIVLIHKLLLGSDKPTAHVAHNVEGLLGFKKGLLALQSLAVGSSFIVLLDPILSCI